MLVCLCLVGTWLAEAAPVPGVATGAVVAGGQRPELVGGAQLGPAPRAAGGERGPRRRGRGHVHAAALRALGQHHLQQQLELAAREPLQQRTGLVRVARRLQQPAQQLRPLSAVEHLPASPTLLHSAHHPALADTYH